MNLSSVNMSMVWNDIHCCVCCSSEPLYKAVGHSRAVSYARFNGRSELVTASVDATIRRWRLDPQSAADGSLLTPVAEFRGHKNSKNFVGLSIHSTAQQAAAKHALVACGSEDGVAHVYNSGSAAARPSTWRLTSVKRDSSEMDRQAACVGHQQEFISSVCWQPSDAAATAAGAPLLAVASSDGDLRLLKLH